MLGVVLKRQRSRCFGVDNPLAGAGHIFFQRVECCLDQVGFAGFVFFLRQARPVFVLGVRAGHDQRPFFALGPRVGIVKRERAAGDVAAEQQIRLESLGRARKQ